MAKQSLKAAGKLQIWAFKDKNFTQQAKGLKQPLKVSVNPESYKRTFQPLKAGKPAEVLANGDIRDIKIVDPPPETFSLELWFDGTGAIPNTKDVEAEIRNFKKFTLLYNGEIHSTNYIKIQWGGTNGLLFKGQLQSLNVDYTLFDKDGKPLRAKATATFVEYVDAKTSESLKSKSSPDLTHIRIAKAGDTLPLMCYRIYGNSNYYVQVAKANGLSNVIALEPGQEIVFPPIEK
ncbi:MAG: LysM peptidoglycan-binding domain-containing protein [Bacteroidota bacterium]